ncbi:MAG: YcaO-like family protein [Deltaproteobacteria bacterium]
MEKIVLEDAFKEHTLDQDKTLSPEETVARFRQRLKQIDLDILEKTERIDNGRLGIPVYFSLCGRDAAAVTGTKKQMGKGGTPQQAEASAVMELAERFSFFSFCNQPENFVTAAYRDIKDNAMPFELIAKSVHDNSADLDRVRQIFENLPMKWTRAYNLSRDEITWVPFDWFFAINEFNGPSAGNCKEEAICQGICEVVERHVSSIVSQNRLLVPAIHPESAGDPLVIEMLSKYKSAGIRIHLSDFSLDTGIPTVGVLAYDPATFPLRSEIVWTAGTTPDPEKALSRALTETAQLGGDFNTGSNYVASGLPKFGDMADTAFIREPPRWINIDALPNIANANIRVEIENAVTALSRKDMDVFLIDTKHPRLGIPAFYTVIPGAHFRERASGTGVGMFSAKLVAENNPPAKAYAKLLEIDRVLPGKYYINFYLGTRLLDMGDHQEAIARLKQALEQNPPQQDIPSICSYMGVGFKELGDYEEAIKILKTGEACDKERTDIYNLMGFCHFKLKQHEKAIENFAKAIELNPGSAIDYANIGSNYREMGDREKAITFYEIALSIDPSIDFARESLAKLKADSS